MRVSAVTTEDLDWVVAALGRRRARLVPFGPIFWRPAPDAASLHRNYLGSQLTDGGALAYRTEDSVLMAVPRGDGWLVDDAYVPDEDSNTSRELWNAFDAECHGARVRLVCPVYEEHRAEFARAVGLTVAETWWLRELPDSTGCPGGVRVPLAEVDAITVAAPSIYDPGGAVLLLPDAPPIDEVIRAAVDRAFELGCPAVVVNQRADDADLARVLEGEGLRRHCDYLEGIVEAG